jgi:hypothetical protein
LPIAEEVPVPVPVYVGFVITGSPPPAPAKPAKPVQPVAAKPAPKPIAIPAPLPPGPPHRPRARLASEEQSAEAKVRSDLDQGQWSKALDDLDEWTRAFPQSKLPALRLYEYMQTQSALAHPDRALEYGAALLSSGQGGLDEQQTASVLYLTMVNAAALPKPSKEQRALGAAAAQSLLDGLPHYFEDSRRPGMTSSEQWRASRKQLETSAREALKKLGGRAGA